MGIAKALEYEHRPPNRLQRLVQAFGASPAGAWFFKHTLSHLDDLLLRISGGRWSAPAVLAGLSVLDIETVGRRSGQLRHTHLIAIPYGDTLALLGTNFGSATTPAWVHNLEADPRLSVSYRGRRVEALARPAAAEEQRLVLERAERIYVGYRLYQERITGRRLRIFVLQSR